MSGVMHITGSETPADMLAELDALADRSDKVVSIGPAPKHERCDCKTSVVRAPLGSGAIAAAEIRGLTIDADILHAWSQQAASAAQWSAKGRPIILSLPHLRGVHQADVAISGCFDGLWTLTVPTAPQRRVLITLGLAPERVFVLPPSARVPENASEHRGRIRRELGLDDDAVLLAAGGEMVHANGHKHACWAHAMARILNDRVRLLFPSSGPAREAVENFSESTGHRRETFFTADRYAPREALSAADAAIFLQKHDCGVSPIADAMACGLPILASNRPEIADCAPDREAALLSDPGDMRQATDNLLKLACDAELRESLGRRAAALAGEKFDPDGARAGLRDIYSAVLSEHS